MARVPGTLWKPITRDANDPDIIPIGFIVHVDAGNAASLYSWWQNPASLGLESTLHIPKQNQTEQYTDTEREADANYKANSFWSGGKRYGFISVETQGYGSGKWTVHQLSEIKRIILWGRDGPHKIPIRVCPTPFSSGSGYHTMWGAPSEWTPVSKSCPGAERKVQWNTIIVPWMKSLAVPVPYRPWVSLKRLQVAFTKKQDDISNDTEQVQQMLNRKYGLKLPTHGVIDDASVAAYKKHQLALGYTGSDADGVPGKTSLEKLGFRVSA